MVRKYTIFLILTRGRVLLAMTGADMFLASISIVRFKIGKGEIL